MGEVSFQEKIQKYFEDNLTKHEQSFRRSSLELTHSGTQTNLLHHHYELDNQEIAEKLLADFSSKKLEVPKLTKASLEQYLRKKVRAWKRISGIDPWKRKLVFNIWFNDLHRAVQEKEIAERMLLDFINGDLE